MSSNNKITIVNQVAGPMCIDIANAFIDKNFDTILITGALEPTYASLNPKVRLLKGIKYRRQKAYLRIFTWVLFTVQCFFFLLFSDKSRKLLFVSNPPLTPFLGFFFCKIFKQTFDLLIYDIYPDILIDLGIIRKRGLINGIWSELNKKTYDIANRVITISDGMKNVLMHYINYDKIEVIPCWVDNSQIKPITPKSDNWFAQKYNQVYKCTVLYSGNMGIAHDMESIIRAAIELKDKEDIHFLLIGDGAKKESIFNIIKKNRLSNVTLLPFQEASVVPFSMACGDISIVTTTNFASPYLIPSKTFYYIAAGSILISICKKDSELDQLISNYNLGKNIPHEIIKDTISQVILTLSREVKEKNKYRISKSANLFSIELAKKFTQCF